MSFGLFKLYLSLGIDHILDIQGYDHLLFLLALCSIFAFKDWKKLALLVTAFTIGHTLTLAITLFGLFNISSYLVEILIPTTIALTSLLNLRSLYKGTTKKTNIRHYWIALLFGLIHGCGFSTYLKAILGDSPEILASLFSFNLGIEIAQLLIVSMYILLVFSLSQISSKTVPVLSYSINVLAFVVAIWMIFERI
ncbi:MAG: HupE/UreJ family protein [Saprospiraceae bacterium]